VSWLIPAANLKTCKLENLQTRIYIPHPTSWLLVLDPAIK
jgi:hypothetical protein